MEIIRVAKERQAAEAAKNASNLLEELDREKNLEESKKAAAARKREKKKRKKMEKLAEKGLLPPDLDIWNCSESVQALEKIGRGMSRRILYWDLRGRKGSLVRKVGWLCGGGTIVLTAKIKEVEWLGDEI